MLFLAEGSSDGSSYQAMATLAMAVVSFATVVIQGVLKLIGRDLDKESGPTTRELDIRIGNVEKQCTRFAKRDDATQAALSEIREALAVANTLLGKMDA